MNVRHRRPKTPARPAAVAAAKKRASLLKKQAPTSAAKAAGLTYVSDAAPGIVRKKRGTGFSYVGPDGVVVRTPATLARIRALAIPPAWTQVWICLDEDGHIQATGRDAKARKQYRYHPHWRETRDDTKFERLLAFGSLLPTIRARVDDDLRQRGLPRNKVIACVVRLLETTLIRVGNEEYARSNQSYGLTTLRNEHVEIVGTRLRFTFRGKSGKDHVIAVTDRRLATLLKQVQHLPGQELLRYLDDDGVAKCVASQDVNTYLREVSGAEFTAKDFRTWFGTVLAARALLDIVDDKPTKKAVNDAVRYVSSKLGNTLAVCRRSYVHPAIFSSRDDGSLAKVFANELDEVEGLPGDELHVLALLATLNGEKLPALLKSSTR